MTRVLMYHALGDRTAAHDPHNMFVTLKSFTTQLEILSQRRRVISMDDYLAGRGTAKDVLLTFDDAYVSTLELAAPELERLDMPATVFVATAVLGGQSNWNPGHPEDVLDVDGLRVLLERGWTVGAHSKTHTDLRGLPATVLEDEIAGCREELTELLGVRPRTFAYPYGLHDAASREAVQRAGFDMGFAVHDASGPMAVPRVDINARDTPRSFRVKLHRLYPEARNALGVLPQLRRALHLATGTERR